MAGTLGLVHVTQNPARIQTMLVPNDTFLLVNPDITNEIFIGNDSSSQIIAVPPLGSITLDPGNHDVWVSTNGASYSVNAYLLPNGTNWTPSPAQVAAQIQALGLATEATQQTVESNTSNTNINLALGVIPNGTATNNYLGGTTPGALVSGAGRSISQDMLHANAGVTSEIAALLATGSPSGLMGGIPLLRFTNKLGNASAQTIGPVNSVPLISFVNVNQPSYECTFIANLPAAAGTLPFVELTFQWNDSNSGLVNDTETFFITSGNGSGNAITTYLSGPVRGDELSVQAFNLDPAQTLTLTWVINSTSHVFERDRLVQPSYAGTAPNGFTNPNGTPSAGLIASISPAVGSNATSTRLLAAYNGKVGLNINARGQTDNFSYSLNDPGNIYSSSGGIFWSTDTPAGGGQQYFNIDLPNGPVLYTIVNRSTTAGAPTCTITRDEY